MELFADDTALWISGNNIRRATTHLQKHIDILHRWFSDWKIIINLNKSFSIVFTYSTKKYHLTQPLDYNNTPISIQNHTRYLGINFHRSTSIKTDIKHIRNNLVIRSQQISIISHRISSNSQNLYKTHIRPLIDYRTTILTSAQKNHFCFIEQTETRILRKLAKVPRDYPSAEIHNVCKLDPLKTRLNKIHRN